MPKNEHLQHVAQQIQQFLEINKPSKIVENKPTKECRQVLVEEVHQSTRLQLKSDHFPGKSFRLKRNHPVGKTKIKTLNKISTEKKPDQDNTQEEKLGEQDFPPPQITQKSKKEKEI